MNPLQDALKSDDDIQIVVPNELLETSEFKSFISSLNSFPVEGSAFASSSLPGTSSTSTSEVKPLASGQSTAAPPNTPNTTRPPSATAEMTSANQIKSSPPPSPQPCSSRELSRGGFNDDPPAILPTSAAGTPFSVVFKTH